MVSFPLTSSLRHAALYAGPAVFIERDITRLVGELEQLAYRQGYAAGRNGEAYVEYGVLTPETVSSSMGDKVFS